MAGVTTGRAVAPWLLGITAAPPAHPFYTRRLFNLKRHHWLHMVIPFVERAAAAKRPLSTIALNEATGKVDGVMIAEDWTSPRPLAYRSALSSEWVPVRALFAELHTRYVAAARGVRGPIFAGDEVRCLYFTCVHPGARHQEVLKGLWRGTIDAARDNGYKTITAQASTDAVRAVLDKTLGFSEVRGEVRGKSNRSRALFERRDAARAEWPPRRGCRARRPRDRRLALQRAHCPRRCHLLSERRHFWRALAGL